MEKIPALKALGFELDRGVYKKFLCEKEGTAYTLTCEPHRPGFKVDKKLPDKSEQTDGAGKYRGTLIYEKIEEIIKALDEKMKEEDVKVFPEEEFTDIKEVPYEEVGEQKKVKLPKPGRRIKNLDAEMMEGGKIRAGEKVKNKAGKLVPSKTPYFTITTMNRKQQLDPNDPDSGFEKDEFIHGKENVGPTPTKLNVRLPCDREDLNFVTFFGKYTSASCDCRGDGYTAEKSSGDIIECHGEECESFKKGECKRHGVLSVILEDAPRCGIVHKFRTTSRNSINNLTASLALLTMCSNGHIAGLPLCLTLTPKETTIPSGTMKGKRTTIYMANLEYRGTYPEMQEHLQRLIAERNGRDPVREVEKVIEASLALPESPEECEDVNGMFFPEGEA